MRHTHSLSLALFPVLLLMGCQVQPKQPSSAAQKRLNEVAFLLDVDSIDAIRVVHSPPAEHPIRITLDTLVSAGGSYVLQLQRTPVELHSQELAEALRSADALNSTWSGEVNWAVVLYNVDRKEMVRIGLDESGRNGYVGADAVRLNSGLVEWARSMLPR
jgi:rhodanese-related sulfurtransferase